jgi:hypothetical protein
MTLSATTKKIIAAAGLLVALVVFLAYASLRAHGNVNVYNQSAARLTAEKKAAVEELMATETASLNKTEQEGLVYYRVGNKTRVYLLWLVVDPNAPSHTRIAELVSAADNKPNASGRLGIAVYVDLSFYVLTQDNGRLLSRYFGKNGLGGIGASCYRWTAAGSWQHVGELSNEAAQQLLTSEQKIAIGRGEFNAAQAE